MASTTQFLITALQRISVSEDLGRGDRIADDIYLTNDRDVIRGRITTDMVVSFGVVEIKAVEESRLVAYRNRESHEDVTIPAADSAIMLFLAELKNLQIALWSIRDNAVSMENAFLEWPYRGRNPTMSTNSWTGLTTNCTGAADEVTFTRDELRRARQMHDRTWARPMAPDLKPGEPTHPDIDRLGRGFYFLQAARSTAALSLKVAMYCSAFEALLGTDITELSHKLAERVAWLVAETPNDRQDVFRAVKSAYAIRSRVIHGSSFSKGKIDTELATAAKDCDDLLRSVLSQVTTRESIKDFYVGNSSSLSALETALLRITLGIE